MAKIAILWHFSTCIDTVLGFTTTLKRVPQYWTSHGAVESSDVQRLPMALDVVTADTKPALGQVLADAGYRSEAVMGELSQRLP